MTLPPRQRGNAVAARIAVALVLAVAGGLVYAEWQDGRAGSGSRSSGSHLIANPPAQLASVGSYVDSRILADGDVRVEHWVRTRAPITAIQLILPRGDGPGGAPKATAVSVAAEQFEASYDAVVSRSAVYLLDHPSRIVRLRYTLGNAVVLSPSAAGRALVRFTSADPVNVPDEGPRIVRIRAAEVLNVACRAPSPGAQPRPCGSPIGTAWQVTLEGVNRADEVSAQVNLGAG